MTPPSGISIDVQIVMPLGDDGSHLSLLPHIEKCVEELRALGADVQVRADLNAVDAALDELDRGLHRVEADPAHDVAETVELRDRVNRARAMQRFLHARQDRKMAEHRLRIAQDLELQEFSTWQLASNNRIKRPD